MKYFKEILWVIIAFIIGVLVLYPIQTTIVYKYAIFNMFIIILGIYYSRIILGLEHVFYLKNKWARYSLFLLNIFLFLMMISRIQDNLRRYDEFFISSYTEKFVLLHPSKESELIQYINTEFLFFGVLSVATIILLNIKLLRSFWVKRSISEI